MSKEKIKDAMINRTASRCLVPSSIVEKVIDFQFDDALKAVKIYNEVEFVGFGKFMISPSKVKKRIKNLEKGIDIVTKKLEEPNSSVKEKSLQSKLSGMSEQLEFLKKKLNNE